MKSKANFQLTSFRTPYYLRNPHSQSIYAGIFLKGESVKYRRERLVTPDEDFFDVDIVDGRGPVVIACHGFEGSSNSTHITRLMTLIQKLGWSGYAINYRSCSGEINNTFYTYNAGKTEDLEQLIWHVRNQNPSRPIFLVGYSFGANILANCISRPKSELPKIAASALISGNYRIEPGVVAMSKGFSRVYEQSFVSSLIDKYKLKESRFPNEINYDVFFESRTLYELDDKITAPYFNFQSASEFYSEISSATHLNKINHPTFMLNSLDDPLSPPACFPSAEELSSSLLNFHTTKKGGHVAFLSRDISYWLEKQIIRWFLFNINCANCLITGFNCITMSKGEIVMGALAPHPPHLVYAENPPQNEATSEGGWEELRWGYERLRDSLSEKDYDVIIIHTPHWATFVGTHFLGVEKFKSLSVDPIFPNIFRYNYDLKVDVELSKAIHDSAAEEGLLVKMMENPDFRIDYGTITSGHLVNPKWDKPIVCISSNRSKFYFNSELMQANMIKLGEATRKAVEASGKKALLLSSNSLSHRHFTTEPEIPEDMSKEHITNHNQYLWDMKMINLMKEGKTREMIDLMPDFTEQTVAETEAGCLTWLMSALGFPDYKATVHAYGTVIGTGNAIIGWDPKKAKI